MQRNLQRIAVPLAAIAAAAFLSGAPQRPKARKGATQGVLMTLDGKRECPLKHSEVKAEISGYVARVRVVQEFENPFSEKIEAVYVFPLPAQAAVDDMTLLIGDRTVRGKIKRREEARAIYEAARDAGLAAALLDQERPNIFTQSVANIRPGEKVKITISYVETLKYEDGNYEWSFPMVVGPRYIPRQGVPDAASITPPVTPKGTRAGHDISVDVALDAGVPINFLRSLTHDVETQRPGPRQALLHLKNKNEIPNKDFVLQYDVSGAKIEDAVLANRVNKNGFFTLVLQPPDRPRAADITPKEIVFVLDTSGSMHGFPIEKAKEAMRLALDGLNPRDTFNFITFSGNTRILFPKPVPATPENVRRAQELLAGQYGSGGTEMMKAIRAALDESGDRDHVRVVCFMTDGYVGNDLEIIGEVRKHPNARVFSFGIGGSVNRFLLDKMAEAGRGEVEYVGLEDDGAAAAKRFYERVRSPLLTDITVEWNGLPVAEVYPQRIPDLFSAKPVILHGRYSGAAKGVIRLTGKSAGRAVTREIPVTLPDAEPRHDTLAALWARKKIDDLMSQDWTGLQSGRPKGDLKEQITQLGLDFRLMTQFTSFVAVEETVITEGGRPRRVEVPVEMPHGVSYEGIYGAERAERKQQMAMALPSYHPGILGGFGAGRGVAPPAAPLERPVESDEPLRIRQMPQTPLRKLDPALAAQIGKKTGKVNVQVWVSDTSQETLRQLKEKGMEILSVPGSGKLVLGKIELDKLQALAELGVVRYVSPLK
ncbi:MAG: VWA domain-containing protein [Candidatus Solibacter usitatus]|nr:VWA domain-containing protein [Candidatus Solibacter usitatus]